MRRSPMVVLAVVVPAVAVLAGCTVAPVSLEGRVCASNADCITGYFCTSELICIPRDAGIDAGHDAAPRQRDAGAPDSDVDASAEDGGELDAADTGTDAAIEIDADTDAATQTDAGTDAAAETDAGIDVGP